LAQFEFLPEQNDLSRAIFLNIWQTELLNIFHGNIVNQPAFIQVADGTYDGLSNRFSHFFTSIKSPLSIERAALSCWQGGDQAVPTDGGRVQAEMGTAFPVSEKRLDAQMQQAEDLCRRLE
jgi:hypothetical protein